MMKSISNIRVYTNGMEAEGIGAYAYIVLGGLLDADTASDGAATILKSKFAQAGKATSDIRMKMRAVYEGVRHCPDNAMPRIYTDHFLVKSILETTRPEDEDGDIAERYRRYIAEHRIKPEFVITKVYNGRDFPDNDHDEWTWWAHYLCENAIKKFKKENK